MCDGVTTTTAIPVCVNACAGSGPGCAPNVSGAGADRLTRRRLQPPDNRSSRLATLEGCLPRAPTGPEPHLDRPNLLHQAPFEPSLAPFPGQPNHTIVISWHLKRANLRGQCTSSAACS